MFMEAASFIFSLSVPSENIRGEILSEIAGVLQEAIVLHEEWHLCDAFAANRWFLNFMLEPLFCSK